jgi:hypothetical protein
LRRWRIVGSKIARTSCASFTVSAEGITQIAIISRSFTTGFSFQARFGQSILKVYSEPRLIAPQAADAWINAWFF